MSAPDPEPAAARSVFARIGVDWWAVIAAGVVVFLVITGIVPKISW